MHPNSPGRRLGLYSLLRPTEVPFSQLDICFKTSTRFFVRASPGRWLNLALKAASVEQSPFVLKGCVRFVSWLAILHPLIVIVRLLSTPPSQLLAFNIECSRGFRVCRRTCPVYFRASTEEPRMT